MRKGGRKESFLRNRKGTGGQISRWRRKGKGRNKGQERTRTDKNGNEVLEESILKKCSRDYEAQVLENVLEIRKTQNTENGFLTE